MPVSLCVFYMHDNDVRVHVHTGKCNVHVHNYIVDVLAELQFDFGTILNSIILHRKENDTHIQCHVRIRKH